MSIASVRLSCGRHNLSVNGLIVAVEGDVCRDPQFTEREWNESNLRQAAAAINKQGKFPYEYKNYYSIESYGDHSFGLRIEVAVNRPFTEKDQTDSYEIADNLKEAVMRETMRTDTKAQEYRVKEQTEILRLFGDRAIFVKGIPNGYCSRWCCSHLPWFEVTTREGVITIGWRKRVISISWDSTVHGGDMAEQLFPDEDSTKIDRMIHAWGYDKAKQYIDKLLSSESNEKQEIKEA